MANNRTLRPFNTLSPEERREISRKGGIASGERRRHLADLRTVMVETLAGYDLAEETREEYRRAIKRYAREERKKMARRKRGNDPKRVQTNSSVSATASKSSNAPPRQSEGAL